MRRMESSSCPKNTSDPINDLPPVLKVCCAHCGTPATPADISQLRKLLNGLRPKAAIKPKTALDMFDMMNRVEPTLREKLLDSIHVDVREKFTSFVRKHVRAQQARGYAGCRCLEPE